MKQNLADRFRIHGGKCRAREPGSERYDGDVWGIDFPNRNLLVQAIAKVALHVGAECVGGRIESEEFDDLEVQLGKLLFVQVGLLQVIT